MPFLAPNPLRIAPPAHEPTHDCVPEDLLHGTPTALRDDLAEIVGAAEVHGRLIDLVKYATDASPYRLFPKAVVTPHTLDEVARLFAYARARRIPVTIRAAGSSLSGQAQGDGLLIDARKHWAGVSVEEAGAKLRVRPGTVMFRANLALAPYGMRLGPDPASYSVATVGGVIANNSSGMCCGTAQNSYQTLESLRFLLPSGTVVDTAAPSAEADFAAAEPALAAGLLAIKGEIEADAALVERLRKKYAIKNTTGYHMAAFLDADTPLQIFRRLLVGSEGTLAFLAEAVFRTVPDDKYRLTSFMIFPDMHAACAAVAPFIAAGAAAAELSDRACLRAVEGKPGVPAHWRELPPDATGLLIEFREPTAERLAVAAEAAHNVLQLLPLYEPATFTTDPTVAAQYWSIRSGLLASIGGVRPSGTSLILEDVCFPTDRLAEGALDLQQLFPRHGYAGAVFGHASAGNLHFLITPSLNTPAEIARFDGFLRDVVALVVGKYDGSLKAEHGTGRNIAPFVEQEWGAKLTAMMWRVKQLADPDMMLAPGVLLTRDPQSHLHNLHTVPSVESEVDRCIECGYCEPVCPSRNFTTTPRQRIALRREMLRQPVDSPIARELLKQYEFEAIETCAGDGSCALACPVDIDTGALMKRFRTQQHTQTQESAGVYAAEHWAGAESLARAALRVNHIAATLPGGSFLAASALNAARTVISRDLVPTRLPNIPQAASPHLPATSRRNAAAVYFHACVNRIFGDDTSAGSSLADTLVAVSARAGLPLWIPEDLPGTCCGTVWHSKGYEDGNRIMANLTVEKMWKWSDSGRLPVVCDASSCTLGLTAEVVPYLSEENARRHEALTIYDSITWASEHLLPRLDITHRVASAAIHPVCSVHTLGLAKHLHSLAAALAETAVTPIHATCCGFAGDRGFLHPELTQSATAEEAAELSSQTHDAYVCSNRTCEIGLNLATGKPFRSIVFLLEELSRPSPATRT
jgi:D-lactate dehydrogenase